MVQSVPEKYISIIEEYIEKYPNLSNIDIAKKIIQDGKIDCSVRTLREYVGKHIDNLQDIVDIELEDAEEGYEVVDDYYQWKTKKGELRFSVEFVDKLFYEYSSHGKNMTQIQMINKYNFKTWEWYSIKSRLLLTKLSNIFSPHTVDITPKKELDKMVQEKMDRMLSDTGEIVEKNYQKSVSKKYKEVIKFQEQENLFMKTITSELTDFLPTVKVVNLKRTNVPQDSVNALVVNLADLHIGAKVFNLQATRDYDIEIVKKYLDIAADKINSYKAKEVHINLLGDLIESFSGLNHINSWQSIDYGMWGAKIIQTAFEILEHFFSKINNLKAINAVGGNHDRSTSSNKEDVTAEIASTIMYFFERIYGGEIDVRYKYDVLSVEIEGINYILTHGHLGLAKNKNMAEKLIIDYGDSTKYTVILSGHLHNREIRVDRAKYRWYVCPPIFTGNRYSKDEGWNGTPGVLLIRANDFGTVDVTDYTF